MAKQHKETERPKTIEAPEPTKRAFDSLELDHQSLLNNARAGTLACRLRTYGLRILAII
jgi:hypothetical protein